MHNYIPSSPGHSPHTKSHDNPHPFGGDYFNTTPEDLEWPVDKEDRNNLDDGDEDEEDEGEGGVAEREADWEPPIGSAEEPEMNDQNIPMEEEGNVDGQRTCRHGAELPLHHCPYVVTFPLDSAGSTINLDELESQQQNGYQSYGEKMTWTHSQDGGSCVWAPFTSHIDYEVARWAKLRGQGSTASSDLLNIEGVSLCLHWWQYNGTDLGRFANDLASLTEILTSSTISLTAKFLPVGLVLSARRSWLLARPLMFTSRISYNVSRHCTEIRNSRLTLYSPPNDTILMRTRCRGYITICIQAIGGGIRR
jgi:hypothetical protein